jgi:ADP-heptose:LPS heptosyltransferase
MDKPKLLLIAYRAFGDFIYTAPVLPYLFEKYDVYLDCSFKVYSMVYDDPRFKKVALFAVENYPDPEERAKTMEERWAKLREQIKPDAEINLNATLEVMCIAERFQEQFHWPVGERRMYFGSSGFYDAIFARIGMTVPNPLKLDGLYFNEAELKWFEKWQERHKEHFVVLLAMAGSTGQKRFANAPELAMKIVEKYPDAVVYMGGGDDLADKVPTHDRIKNICGSRIGLRQAVLITKGVDMVIGPETFLLVAAGMWGTPKCIMATTSSVWQMTQYQKNDYSIQAPIWCSPCHRAIYATNDCESMLTAADGSPLYPACTTRFALEPIMERLGKVYAN